MLPPAFTLQLDAGAFGPNAAQPFSFRAGDQERQARIGAEHGKLSIAFDNVGDARTLIITIPRPISPQETGLSGDQRKLGIALYSLKVAPR